MKLPKRNFYKTDLFNQYLYAKCWSDSLYITCSFIAKYIYDDARLVAKLSKGDDDFWLFLDTIQTYNRCYVKLIDESEVVGALPFIRLQMDNLAVLYAESKDTGNILHKLFDNKREFNQVKVNGKEVKKSTLIRELDEKYNGLLDIWEEYNLYTHPTYKTNSKEALCLDSYYNHKLGKEVIPQRIKKELYKDMVFVNKVIVDVLYSILDQYIDVIKKHKQYTFYKQIVADTSFKII